MGAWASSDRADDVLTVRVSGEVDLSTGTVVETAIADAIATEGVAQVCVDLSGVTFLDSSGVALLLKGRRDAEAHGVGYQVAGAQGAALQVLQLTGVWAHLGGEGAPERPTLS